MRSEVLALFAFLLLFGTGCAGARTTVIADTSHYPVSLSPSVRDADGRVVAGEQLERAGAFRAEATAWGTLYSVVPITPKTDISKAVNSELERTHGDALVNLRISTTQCASDWAVFLNIVPIWPGCAKLVVEGDIVRVKRGPGLTRAKTATPSRLATATLEAQAF